MKHTFPVQAVKHLHQAPVVMGWYCYLVHTACIKGVLCTSSTLELCVTSVACPAPSGEDRCCGAGVPFSMSEISVFQVELHAAASIFVSSCSVHTD